MPVIEYDSLITMTKDQNFLTCPALILMESEEAGHVGCLIPHSKTHPRPFVDTDILDVVNGNDRRSKLVEAVKAEEYKEAASLYSKKDHLAIRNMYTTKKKIDAFHKKLRVFLKEGSFAGFKDVVDPEENFLMAAYVGSRSFTKSVPAWPKTVQGATILSQISKSKFSIYKQVGTAAKHDFVKPLSFTFSK